MKRVVVQDKTKPNRVEQNQRPVENGFAERAGADPDGERRAPLLVLGQRGLVLDSP